MRKDTRKLTKKQHKLKAVLLKDYNIVITDCCTRHLVIGNGGLDIGICRETLEKLLCQFGEVLDINMQERKSYSFVSYSHSDEATTAFNHLQGYTLKHPEEAPTGGVKLYLAFVDTVPGLVVPDTSLPEGCQVVPDFVSEEEETALLNAVDWNTEDEHLTPGSRQSLKHRRVKHYGYEFLYGSNTVDPSRPLRAALPAPCVAITQRMRDAGLIAHAPDQLTVNQYLPGQGIPPHVDTHSAFEDGIFSLSLGSQAVMKFRHPDGRHKAVLLPRRSLLVMRGESRYLWTHGITPRKQDIVAVSACTPQETWPSGCRDTGVDETQEAHDTVAVSACTRQGTEPALQSTTHAEAGSTALGLTQEHVTQAVHTKTIAETQDQLVQSTTATVSMSVTQDRTSECDLQSVLSQEISAVALNDVTSDCQGLSIDSEFVNDSVRQTCSRGTSEIDTQTQSVSSHEINAEDITDSVSQVKARVTLAYRQTRTSFTFRTILHGPCKCGFPEKCDSQRVAAEEAPKNTPALPASDSEAAKLEAEHVHQVYEEIAGHFSDTRHTPWPHVVAFLQRQRPGSLVLDVGCGNGKYLAANRDCLQIGCDRSAALCAICAGRGHPVFVSDCLALPVRDGAADVCISIAVIHHLATRERRCLAVREMARVLRPGGHALVSVWAKEQKLDRAAANPYLKQEKKCSRDVSETPPPKETELSTDSVANQNDAGFTNHDEPHGGYVITSTLSEKRHLDIHVNRTEFRSQDLLVPWHLKESHSNKPNSEETTVDPVFHRYYHVFETGELEALCAAINNIEIIESYYDKGNWCVIFQKIK